MTPFPRDFLTGKHSIYYWLKLKKGTSSEGLTLFINNNLGKYALHVSSGWKRLIRDRPMIFNILSAHAGPGKF